MEKQISPAPLILEEQLCAPKAMDVLNIFTLASHPLSIYRLVKIIIIF